MITKVKKLVSDNKNNRVNKNFRNFVNENQILLNSTDSKAINEKLNSFLADNSILHVDFKPVKRKMLVTESSKIISSLNRLRLTNRKIYNEVKKVFESKKNNRYIVKLINESYSILFHKYGHLSRAINENAGLDLTTGTFNISSIQELKDNFSPNFVKAFSADFDNVALNELFTHEGELDLTISKDPNTMSGYTASVVLNAPDVNDIDQQLEISWNTVAKQFFEKEIVEEVSEAWYINEALQFEDSDIQKKAKELMKPEDIDHHASDLYLKVNDISKKLVDEYEYKSVVTQFKSKTDGGQWYEIPFAYNEHPVNEAEKTISVEKLMDMADRAGEYCIDAKEALKELGSAYGSAQIPLDAIEERLYEYDMELSDVTDEVFEKINEDATEPEIITQLKKIVSDQQYADLKDSVTGSTVRVDMGSASSMLQIYDNINDIQKADFISKGLVGMQDLANKIYGKMNESVDFKKSINESYEDYDDESDENLAHQIYNILKNENKEITQSNIQDVIRDVDNSGYSIWVDELQEDSGKLIKIENIILNGVVNEQLDEEQLDAIADSTGVLDAKLDTWDGKGELKFIAPTLIKPESEKSFIKTAGSIIEKKFGRPYQVEINNNEIKITSFDNINENAGEFEFEYTPIDNDIVLKLQAGNGDNFNTVSIAVDLLAVYNTQSEHIGTLKHNIDGAFSLMTDLSIDEFKKNIGLSPVNEDWNKDDGSPEYIAKVQAEYDILVEKYNNGENVLKQLNDAERFLGLPETNKKPINESIDDDVEFVNKAMKERQVNNGTGSLEFLSELINAIKTKDNGTIEMIIPEKFGSMDVEAAVNILNKNNFTASANELKSLYPETVNEDDSSDEITMNNLDWGKTTEERNKNLDIFNSLKTEEEKQDFIKKLKGVNNSVNEAGEDFINEYVNKDDKFKYMLLSRMQSDCEYYLGNGGRADKHLFMGNVPDQITLMNALWDSFTEKPEWLSKEQIDEYAEKMGSKVNESDDSEGYNKFIENYPSKPVGGSDRVSFDVDYKNLSNEDKKKANEFYKSGGAVNEDEQLDNFYKVVEIIKNYGYQLPQELFDEYLTTENVKSFIDQYKVVEADSDVDNFTEMIEAFVVKQVEAIFPKDVILQYI